MLNRKMMTGLVIGLGIVFGGCSLTAKPADVTTESPTVTLKGVISVNDAGFFLTEGLKITALDSRKVDLKSYVGKVATVVGEYSGTTLFVDSVK